MILIACVDDNMGMAFNNRRQSQDRVLRDRLLERVGTAKLWMSPYSARQFEVLPESAQVCEDFLSRAGAGEYCFVELECPEKAEEVMLYHWNRAYPADVRFTLKLEHFRRVEQTEFSGSSHPKITEEIYIYEASK